MTALFKPQLNSEACQSVAPVTGGCLEMAGEIFGERQNDMQELVRCVKNSGETERQGEHILICVSKDQRIQDEVREGNGQHVGHCFLKRSRMR
jgi:hypothetical protein